MSWIKPDALARARGHVSRISARLSDVGMPSSTLTRLQIALDTDYPANPKTGWLVITSDQLTQLRTMAADLEAALLDGHALYLGNIDLPQLRYLLSEEVVA